MDRKEMEAKLTKHGLPTWGTDEQVKARLESNCIISSRKVSFEPKKEGESGSMFNPNLDTLIVENPSRYPVMAQKAVIDAPRKMCRPKKVK